MHLGNKIALKIQRIQSVARVQLGRLFDLNQATLGIPKSVLSDVLNVIRVSHFLTTETELEKYTPALIRVKG